ncbi:NAD(P)-dependent oxidoreductase [Methylobacterium brachythecii]|uniref:3-hydroxyisobutyrate dehydrogenase-like beta-hydroxyacid dehydrogenase n=1 Tax=Methylobacterium brachythecii TaxID=1176177 RepID=A0A7W6F975_9HYPH|nr:NAD(P)-dependent oxidoreductase [Methylobacterium brachythecii]MBB3905194.1 3-hydroxyisobutyrate dehydrogenase-like beta-hydroxyacid dehydrogenase [Methylobacterium brachythecii]GLS46234.1 6-phosphogluconate dehydrogenase [Methylobacterium brachythecii]
MRTVAIVAPGAMGSAIAARLTENGVRVLTSLEGRGEQTRERARAAGMSDAADSDLARADLLLSIVPPADAMGVAHRFAGPLAAAGEDRAIYVDCNAINVETKREVAGVIAAGGTTFLDGAIIGLPPKPGAPGPRFYIAGDDPGPAVQLRAFGLDMRPCEGGIGAAAGLKMSFAGLNKGLTALAATMVLAAARAGSLEALRAELAETEPALLARFERGLPDMVPKAYRWAPEMREIAGFVGDDEAGRSIFEGAERLYARLARDEGADDVAALRAFAAGARRGDV